MNHSAQTAGTLDESFADAGIFRLTAQPAGSNNLITGIVQTPTHLLFSGHSNAGLNTSAYLLGRLNLDGTLDDTFGTQGIVRGFFSGTGQSNSRSISLCSDGKILLAGWLEGAGPALARYFPDGTLDTAFGSEGHVVLRLPVGAEDQTTPTSESEGPDSSYSAETLADGKILVVNSFVITSGSNTRAFVLLLNSDGSPDTSFNQTGYVQALYPGAAPADVRLRNGLIDANGNITVCGYLTLNNRENSTPLFARYTRDGQLDTTFGQGGFVVFNGPRLLDAQLVTMIGQPNNRLLGIGRTKDLTHGVLISLEPDGSSNIQFNRAQPLLTRLDNADTGWQTAVMQPDGKILVTGTLERPGQRVEPVTARLLSDGSFDTTFNNVGWVSTPLEGTAIPSSITLQADGKILVAGRQGQGFILRFHGAS